MSEARWYAASMDELRGPFATRREAVASAGMMVPRSHGQASGAPGLWVYREARSDGPRRAVWYVGQHEALVLHGWPVVHAPSEGTLLPLTPPAPAPEADRA